MTSRRKEEGEMRDHSLLHPQAESWEKESGGVVVRREEGRVEMGGRDGGN